MSSRPGTRFTID